MNLKNVLIVIITCISLQYNSQELYVIKGDHNETRNFLKKDNIEHSVVSVIYPDWLIFTDTIEQENNKYYINQIKNIKNMFSFEGNDLIIKVQTDSKKRISDQLKKFGKVIDKLDRSPYLQLETEIKEAALIDALLLKLKDLSGVEKVQKNQYFTLRAATNDSLYENQWYLENTGSSVQGNGTPGADIDIMPAWEKTFGEDIVVAVMDSGVDTLHPEFEDRLLSGFDAFSTDSLNTNGYPFLDYNENAHGTACAGIIGAGQDNVIGISGVAPQSKITPVRMFFYINYLGQIVPFTNMNAIIMASHYSWNTMNADVISCSAGLNDEYINLLSIDTALCNAEVRQGSIDGRNGKGVVMLFSAGNENNNEVLWPGNLKETIAVGASTMCDTRKYPGDCSGLQWGSTYGQTLDFVAPGVLIATCDITGVDGYNSGDYTSTFGGTSAACPVSAGVSALLLSYNPTLHYDEVKFILNSTTEKITPYDYDSLSPYGTWNEEVGHGRINANSALSNASIGFNHTDFHQEEEILIYPNPVENELIIQGKSGKEYTYLLYSVLGEFMQNGRFTNSGYVNTTHLNKGMYFVKVNNQIIPIIRR